MTTLHEEPSSRQTLTEEVEDSYSETDENDDSDSIAQPQPKSKFPISKTMGSLRDIGSSNFKESSTRTAIAPASVINSDTANQTARTPSMTSSTSSGYGSQAVSYSNLTSDDTLSLRSMSVDDTPGKRMPSICKYDSIRFNIFHLHPDSDRNGSSPPKNNHTQQSIMTPYTPINGQKRFNPFMKDIPTPNTDSQHTIIATNNHKSHTIAQQNDENKNIIAIDDTNQNPLSAGDSEINANRGKKVASTTSVTTPKKVEADSTTDMITSQMTNSSNSDVDSTEMTISQTEVSMPDWVVVGESVLIRPYNTSGVISFIGSTHFQVNQKHLMHFFFN